MSRQPFQWLLSALHCLFVENIAASGRLQLQVLRETTSAVERYATAGTGKLYMLQCSQYHSSCIQSDVLLCQDGHSCSSKYAPNRIAFVAHCNAQSVMHDYTILRQLHDQNSWLTLQPLCVIRVTATWCVRGPVCLTGVTDRPIHTCPQQQQIQHKPSRSVPTEPNSWQVCLI